jgi:hypothetical protein
MSLVTLNGARVQALTLHMPRVGLWHGVAIVDSRAAVAPRVTLTAPELSLVGANIVGSSFLDSQCVRLVAGAGGLRATLPARGYRSPTVRLILQDLARESGETLSTTIAPAVLARTLPFWTRAQGSGGQSLATLATALGVSWRVLDDGSIWVGTLPTVEVVGAYQVIDERPHDRWLMTASSAPFIRPGSSIRGRAVREVSHTFEGDRVRSEVFYE